MGKPKIKLGYKMKPDSKPTGYAKSVKFKRFGAGSYPTIWEREVVESKRCIPTCSVSIQSQLYRFIIVTELQILPLD